MDLVSSIVVFVMAWWVIFFISLPFGVHPVNQKLKGIDRGAPENPHIPKKLLITSILTLLIWMMIDYLFEIGLVDLHRF